MVFESACRILNLNVFDTYTNIVESISGGEFFFEIFCLFTIMQLKHYFKIYSVYIKKDNIVQIDSNSFGLFTFGGDLLHCHIHTMLYVLWVQYAICYDALHLCFSSIL